MPQTLRSLFAAALALSAAGCTSAITTVRGTYASMMQCPVEQVFAREGDGYFAVDGCGRHARCSEPEGPCKEVFTDVQRLELARQTFSQETPCPVPAIQVYFDGGALVADGCGRYATCPAPGGPCFNAPRPTCESFAQRRLDFCRQQAQANQPDRNAYWGNPLQVASAVDGVIKSSRGVNECNAAYQQDLKACQQAAAAQPAP